MPNWCHNSGEIRTTSWETATSIINHTTKGTLLDWIKPMPKVFEDIHSGSAIYKDDNGEEQRTDFWYSVPYKAGLGWSRYVEKPGFRSFPGGWGKSRVAPVPQALLDEWKTKYGTMGWYDWNINNWGTKWDVCDGWAEVTDQTDLIAPRSHVYTVELSFETAWAPPERAYETLWERDDIEYVNMYYEEPGMGFKGYWDNGEDKPEEWKTGHCDQCETEMLIDDDGTCHCCGLEIKEVIEL